MSTSEGGRPKKDISGWASATPTYGEDGEPIDEDDVSVDDREEFDVETVQNILITGRRKDRLAVLSRLQSRAPKGASSEEFVRALLVFAARYTDLVSTEATIAALSSLSAGDSDGPSYGVWGTWVQMEVARCLPKTGSAAVAPSTFFALVLHLNALIATKEESLAQSDTLRPLLFSLAVTLDAVLDSERGLRPSVRQGAIKRTRRTLRTYPSLLPAALKLLTSAPSNPSPTKLLPLLGLVIDVCLHLRGKGEGTKGTEGGVGEAYVKAVKDDVLEVWKTGALSAVGPLGDQVWSALRFFFRRFLDVASFESLVATSDKAFGKSPESGFQGLSATIFHISTFSLAPYASTKLLTPILAHAKSPKAEVRAAAVAFCSVLISKLNQDLEGGAQAKETILDEMLGAIKSGKTNSPDHRIALYSMIQLFPLSPASALKIVTTLPPQIAKETTSEPALVSLLQTLSPNLATTLASNMAIPAAALAALQKELASPKAATRRAVVASVGNALWTLGESSDNWTEQADKFGEVVGKILADVSLKNVSTNALTAAAGVGEGFVAAAVLLGPLSKSKSSAIASLLSSNTILQSITATSPKPSFLLWEKAQRRTASAEEEMWLLRGLQAFVGKFDDKLAKDEALRIQLGLSFINLAFTTQYPSTRRDALASLRSSVQVKPKVASRVIRDSLKAWLLQREAKSATTSEEILSVDARAKQILQILTSAVSFPAETPDQIKDDALADIIIFSHHAELGSYSMQSFVDIVVGQGVDPAKLVERTETRILKLFTDATSVPIKSVAFAEAAYRAARTLSFISPDALVQQFLSIAKTDLDPQHLDFIGTQELGIWNAPEGSLFVDVLAKKTTPLPTANRNNALDKWEKEVRESAAKKKAATSNGILSKADQALVDKQRRVEDDVQVQIETVKHQMQRGLAIIRSLITADVEPFKSNLTDVLQLIMNGPLDKGAFLVGDDAFQTFLRLGDCCSPRLGVLRSFIGIAILRNYGSASVPEQYTEEPIAGLLLRVLYRLRTLSEHASFDSTTYAYITPLLTTVIAKGATDGLAVSEEITEQLALVLEIVDFHCEKFGDPAFPRLSTLTDLISLIGSQPLLRKSAASALISLGEAIKTNATLDEIRALLKGTLSQEVVVRNASLQALQPLDLTDFDYSSEIWIAVHDEDPQNARLASGIWEDNGLDVPDTFIPKLLPFVEHDNAYVRNSCALAFGEGIQQHPELISEVNVALEELYIERAKILAPEFDEYGMVREESLNRADPSHIRLAIADTFRALASSFTSELLVPFFKFLIEAEALGDRSAVVRRGMLDAATLLIDVLGETRLSELIAVFEDYLSRPSSGSEAGDHISEAVVILFGRIASFLEASDPRVPKVVDRLVEALKTPSEVVQAAVSDCIPALVKRMRQEVAPLVDRLFDMLINGGKYAERRGAAYGIAGVVKGRGLSSLKEFGLMDKLEEAARNKESHTARQGALLAFETLSATLGRVFEPYVENILPLLLQSFGDGTTDVREACEDASKVLMSRLSGHCVNIILPSLLAGLEEKQWRTKKGSIELLGAMAFCAPKQLATSLPTIIPELTAVLTDSHTQVRQAANASLKRFGEVIHNPEIKALVPTLLKALVDPTGKTAAALTHLLNTAFAHFIDAPSLALVTPIIERGMRERSAQSKRKSVQILGNLSSLTDPKDFTPYLTKFMPLVHVVLVDPVPEARGTAAKALGTLVERLGEDCFPDLVNGLLVTLRSDTSGVDRQGAAQGLSEVLSGLGMDRLEGLLPEIITNASSPRHYVREGFISLLVYLPTTFGHRFSPHLGRIIPPILAGLADESEYVRDASMRAGKMIIGNYSAKAVDLLLPELLNGMTDERWRIRQSSVSLTGELLFKISGISGKAEIEVEDGAETSAGDSSRKALLEALGPEKRDKVLSALYVIRQDAVGAVRTASVHIWKALVQNTPRTLREILPSVIEMVITLLSSPGVEQKETASRTLGELCKKNGERIIAEMIPMLRSSVTSPDANVRIGACLAFSEILDSATELQLEEHQDAIIAGVRTALVDESTSVRAAAAQSFDVLLQSEFGTKAIDQTIPTLLEALRQPGAQSETALRALREIMSVRANSIFPVVLPALIGGKLSAFNARALGSLVSVAGSALSRRLTSILQALVVSIESDNEDEEVTTEVNQTMRILLSSIEDIEGLNSLMMTLLGWAKGDAPRRRVSALSCFQVFCEVTEEDFSEYRVDWIRQLISAYADPDDRVVEAAWLALEAMVKTVPKDELENLVIPLRSSVESTAAPGNDVPGFSRPKGVQSIVPILLAGVLGGTHDQREQAALGVGDLVLRTSEAGIKPYIVQLTGPLIRVISSQAFPPAIKNAILGTLTVLLRRVPHLVRPFQPQLQRTFVKSVSDPASISIRNHAAEGLGVLMISQARVDPLITELVTAIRTSEPEIAASLAHALACVAHTASKNMSPSSKALIEELVSEAFQSPGLEPYSDAIARVISGLAINDPQDVVSILESHVFASRPATLTSMVLFRLVSEVPSSLQALDIHAPVVKQVLDCASVFDNPSVARPARETRDLLKGMHDQTLDALLSN